MMCAWLVVILSYKAGDKSNHRKFGIGRIINVHFMSVFFPVLLKTGEKRMLLLRAKTSRW